MTRSLLINAAQPEETRTALVVDGRLEAYDCARSIANTLVGNIYKGRVVNLEEGIGAAFVDVGIGRNAFLHVSDLVGARDGDRIADHLSVRDDVVVQVTRASIGEKGPVLTALVTLAGRYVVLLPHARAGGVSRRIEDRARLLTLARDLEQLAGMGVILRTASRDGPEAELRRDTERLVRLWDRVQKQAESARAPAPLLAHSDLVWCAVRDAARVDEIIVDTPAALERATEAARTVEPGLEPLLRLHASGVPLFHSYGVEDQVDALRERRVALPGGGSLVIDKTEALVAIDVNSGRTRHEDGLEETALRTNLEAAGEVARQLRLRDLGGIVVVDFIDMKHAEHLKAVEDAFRADLRKDPVRVRPGRMGEFCVFVLTRQRAGGGSVEGMDCRHCGGSGVLVEPEQAALRVWRELLAHSRRPDRIYAREEVAHALSAIRGEQLEAFVPPVSIETAEDVPESGWRI